MPGLHDLSFVPGLAFLCSWCFGPRNFALLSNWLPVCFGGSRPQDFILISGLAPLVSHLFPSLLWVLWAACFCTCLPVVSHCPPASSENSGPRDFPIFSFVPFFTRCPSLLSVLCRAACFYIPHQVSHSALGFDLFPTCLPLSFGPHNFRLVSHL